MKLSRTQEIQLQEIKTGVKTYEINNSASCKAYFALIEKRMIREMFTHIPNPTNGWINNKLIGWKIDGKFYKNYR